MERPKGWNEQDAQLVRTFRREDFRDAVRLVNKILPLAEAMKHHPDIEIHNYNEVTVRLSTHDVGKVTEKDIDLATRINGMVT